MSTTATLDQGVAPPGGRVVSFRRRLRAGDEVAYLITLIAAGTIFLITALVFYEVFSQSALSRHKFGWSFLITSVWDPVAGTFGALPFIYGTVVTSILGLLVAVPEGIGSAIFLSEMAPPRLSNACTFLIELLAAVPSVIYGLLGIFILVPILERHVVPPLKSAFGWLPIFQGPFYGVSLFSAGIVLSIMIVPFIVSVSREVLLAVPRDQREASLALGASQWQTTWRVVVPNASSGIVGSIFLALARALGETMAVTMVIGNTPQIKASLLAPGDSIASVIANQFTEATGDLYLSALIELGLVLFGVTFVLNGLARILIIATSRKGAHS
ncbi:MAG: phosphate ABC transporter permease subunit PstC [Acidobacteriaceae bacterium]|nr:phosphate ABC transporter permease subunit PstC [Acidobacteriaceae bacterium]MBV9500171.1 phosphate ABC transporter permease subunit PstC [Acidobacteriaceae bacterium]